VSVACDVVAGRPSLALVIPTYARAQYLKHTLTMMAKDIAVNNVAVYISDDSTDDETEFVIEDISRIIPGIRYRHNVPPLRHDLNIVQSLLWPDEDYVWVLGDTGWIKPGGFSYILDKLEGHDFLFINSHDQETEDRPLLREEEGRRLVQDKMWHQTLTGATIYSRRLLNWLQHHSPSGQGLVRNFPHLSILVDFIKDNSFTTGWIGKQWTSFLPKNSYWRKQALSVFADDWAAAIKRQPTVITPAQYASVLRSHDQNMGLFNVGLLVELRASGALNRRYLKENPDIWHIVAQPEWVVRSIATIPVWAAKAAHILKRRWRD
jgi:abequosyltransferase